MAIGTALLALVGTPAAAGDAGPATPAATAQLAQGADGAARALEVPAGDLQSALMAVSDRFDLQLVYPARLTAGLESPALEGTYTAREALARLLDGTGLTYRFTDAGTVTLEPAAAADETGPMRLAPLEVTSTLVGTRVGETVEESAASVDLFTGQELDERPDTREVRDLYEKTPNVVDFGEGVLAPAIRGVDSTGAASGGLGFIAGTRPRATLTVDGRPLSTAEFIGGPTGLWDVEQVEVYRGPQTTLQGRNSIAGALVVETKDPTFFWEDPMRATDAEER